MLSYKLAQTTRHLLRVAMRAIEKDLICRLDLLTVGTISRSAGVVVIFVGGVVATFLGDIEMEVLKSREPKDDEMEEGGERTEAVVHHELIQNNHSKLSFLLEYF